MNPSATPAEKQNVHHLRQKLQQFLEKSTHYTPETVLLNLPHDRLFEERAIILGRLGRHQQAISIYVNLLNDVPRAIQYCNNVYAKFQGLCFGNWVPIFYSIFLTKYSLKGQTNSEKKKQQDDADEVYVILIKQLLKPENTGIQMAGKYCLSNLLTDYILGQMVIFYKPFQDVPRKFKGQHNPI